MQQQISFLDSLFGKTCQEPSAATKEKISGQSSRVFVTSGGVETILYLCLQRENGNPLGALWEMVAALPGGCTTLSIGESPSVARESTLSQILDLNAPEKYSLSPRACAGIIRRAEKREKELPDMLREALMEVIGLAGGLDMIEEEPEEEDIDGLEEDEDI